MAAALQREVDDSLLGELDEFHVAAVGLHVRAHGVQRLQHPLAQPHRVEVVDQQQARHRAVLAELVEDRRARLARGPDGRDDSLQAVAVHRDHRGDELRGEPPRPRIGELLHPRRELLHSREQLRGRRGGALGDHRPGGRDGGHQANAVGVCITFRTRPPPVYMCTPHGRHGSKERTARMMSMPLKLSGPFSSKIGVFWTASS